MRRKKEDKQKTVLKMNEKKCTIMQEKLKESDEDYDGEEEEEEDVNSGEEEIGDYKRLSRDVTLKDKQKYGVIFSNCGLDSPDVHERLRQLGVKIMKNMY